MGLTIQARTLCSEECFILSNNTHPNVFLVDLSNSVCFCFFFFFFFFSFVQRLMASALEFLPLFLCLIWLEIYSWKVTVLLTLDAFWRYTFWTIMNENWNCVVNLRRFQIFNFSVDVVFYICCGYSSTDIRWNDHR